MSLWKKKEDKTQRREDNEVTGAETEAIGPQTKRKECPLSLESGKSRGNFSPGVAEQGWPSY